MRACKLYAVEVKKCVSACSLSWEHWVKGHNLLPWPNTMVKWGWFGMNRTQGANQSRVAGIKIIIVGLWLGLRTGSRWGIIIIVIAVIGLLFLAILLGFLRFLASTGIRLAFRWHFHKLAWSLITGMACTQRDKSRDFPKLAKSQRTEARRRQHNARRRIWTFFCSASSLHCVARLPGCWIFITKFAREF